MRPHVPVLEPGERYLLEVVVRTLKLGHHLTQGTSDSNQIWLDVVARDRNGIVGRSGGMGPEREVDPWSHFQNSFVLDREGNRINRRNAEDIFTPLYNHQIPPGAADVVHYLLEVPSDVEGPIEVEVRLRYRKFDTEYMQFVRDDEDWINDLPILELAQDRLEFPTSAPAATVEARDIEEWQRWNDYGIGLLRKIGQGQLRQAEEAFTEVERLGLPDGPLNLARVYLREGRVTQEAPDALQRARDFDPPAREWTILWLAGMVNKQNGELDAAISAFDQILEGGFQQARGAGFDFTKDYVLLVELANTVYLRARQERGSSRAEERNRLLRRAEELLLRALELDPENVAAHYNLSQVYADLQEPESASRHAELHQKYKPDDNATDRAIATARRQYPAANHAAEGVVIYDLRRRGAFELPEEEEDQ